MKPSVGLKNCSAESGPLRTVLAVETNGVSKSVQVLLNDIEAVMVLALIVLKQRAYIQEG